MITAILQQSMTYACCALIASNSEAFVVWAACLEELLTIARELHAQIYLLWLRALKKAPE